MEPFTVVMSLYRSDDPAQFRAAFDSLLAQTVLPDEIILVVDGPVGDSLEPEIATAEARALTRVIRLPENRGLGAARHMAIEAARNDVIAVMDADDIAVPERFALQISALARGDADLVGGYIEEFDVVPGDAGRIRLVPIGHDDIVAFGRWRQPVNHVTIMFRRKAYRTAGGYRPVRSVEDFDLLARMLVSGARFANVPSVLVHVRSGHEMYRRRGGITYLGRELALLRRMLKNGYLSPAQFVGNVTIRVALRLLPSSLLGVVYRKGLRRRARPIAGASASNARRPL